MRKNDSTGQYKVVTDLPQTLACSGATTVFNPLNTYAHANNNSSNPFVGKNPATSGCYEVKVVAHEVGGTTHTDVDTHPAVRTSPPFQGEVRTDHMAYVRVGSKNQP